MLCYVKRLCSMLCFKQVLRLQVPSCDGRDSTAALQKRQTPLVTCLMLVTQINISVMGHRTPVVPSSSEPLHAVFLIPAPTAEAKCLAGTERALFTFLRCTMILLIMYDLF